MATTKNKETAIEKPIPPGALVQYEYGEDEGRGYEHQSSADTRIPIINQLQDLSPAVKARKANVGDFLNTVTEQIWAGDEGFLFVPATTRHVFVEWVPREQGGGYRGQHAPDSDIVLAAMRSAKKDPDAKFGEYFTEDGNELQETFYVFGALCTEDGQAESMALIPFYSTKIRPYKGWMTRLRQTQITDAQGRRVRPPLYAHLTRIKSTMDRKANNDFAVPVISSGDPRGVIQSLLKPDDERFMMAKACMQLVDSDQAKVDYEQTKGDGDPEAPKTDGGKKTPF
jgi:hypothetical protein